MAESETTKPQERTSYIPAEVTVIEITAHSVMCWSLGSDFDEYSDGGTY